MKETPFLLIRKLELFLINSHCNFFAVPHVHMVGNSNQKYPTVPSVQLRKIF